ncbi:Uncharacterized protein dnm_051940 [Desulfonema magnum]|uniref:Uncharacterized protein n=1 Tax=Desulfonema magnum TaxID=45655 RepID=A0A975GPT2_9BACT|nr:Uncharacterized protein dnm_051940 [Desulfonema magnum]
MKLSEKEFCEISRYRTFIGNIFLKKHLTSDSLVKNQIFSGSRSQASDWEHICVQCSAFVSFVNFATSGFFVILRNR